MNESDIILLINYLHGLPQRVQVTPSNGDAEKVDEYWAIFTNRQRRFIIEALRAYHPPHTIGFGEI